MNGISGQKTGLVISVLLVALNVILLNVLVGRTRVFRIDMTQGGLYTLSDESLRLLGDLEEPVDLTFFYSSREAQHDWIRPLIDPMKDILAEFDAEGGKNVRFKAVELDSEGEKAREEAANQYGVRPFTVPVKTTFESGVKSTYFSLVVAVGGAYKELSLQSNFAEMCRYVDTGTSNQQGGLELADIEYLVSKTIHQLTRGFNSVPGALMAHDARAEVTVYLSDGGRLPEALKDLKDTITKVTDAMARKADGRLTTAFESPLQGKTDRREISGIAQALYRSLGVRPVQGQAPDGQERLYYASMVVKVGDRHDLVEFSSQAAPGESDIRESIEGMVKPLIPGLLATVGLSIPKAPPANPMMGMRQPQRSEFAFVENMLGRDFQVETVDLSGDSPKIPRKVEVMVLIRPEGLGEKAIFELDQFVMRGGRLVVMADAHYFDPQRAQMAGGLPVKDGDISSLSGLLAYWGVKLGTDVLQDTRCSAMSIPMLATMGGMQVQVRKPIRYPMALVLDDDGLDRQQPITSSVQQIEFYWASPVEVENAPEGVEATVLARTSKQASTVAIVPDVRTVDMRGYKAPAGAHSHSVALSLSGVFPSYYKDRPVPGLEAPAKKKDEGAKDSAEPAGDGSKDTAQDDGKQFEGALLKKSRKTNIVVFGDSDFLSPTVMDTAELSRDGMLEHLKLLKNAIDYGGPDSVILKIRNRAPAVRSLTAFTNMTPDEKKSEGAMAAWWTAALSCAAVVLLGIGWVLARAGRKPLLQAAPAAGTAKGGEA